VPPSGEPERPDVTVSVPARRSYAWIVAPLAAAGLVAWGSSVNLLMAHSVVRGLAVVSLYAGSAVLAVTPGVAVLSVAARRAAAPLGAATALALLLVGSGATAMAGFWAWFATPVFGRVFDGALLVAAVAVLAVFGRRGDLRAVGLTTPLLLSCAVGLACTGLAFVQGGIAHHPSAAIQYRFWQAGDNVIPLQFAMRVAAHGPLSGALVGDWLSSDRPPLQTGFVLLQWPLWLNGSPQLQAPYQLLATALSASWLPALWTVFRVRGVGIWRVAVAVLATAATGVVFFNTIYVWPKMLAGTFALAALALLVSRDKADRRPASMILVLALVALSMLSHGGTAFAVIALIPLLYKRRREFTRRVLAWCAVAVVALYVPWTLYQKFVDPPGDRLIKWQLAGVIAPNPIGVVQALVRQYSGLTLTHALLNKWENVATLVANPVLWRNQTAEPVWASGFLGFARLAQVNDLVPAAGPLLLGVVALLIPSARRALAQVAPLAAFVGLTLVVWVLLLWGGQGVPAVNHQGPYAVIILFIGLCALAVTALPKALAALIVAGGLAWFVVSWVPGLGFVSAIPVQHVYLEPVTLDPALLATAIAGLLGIAVVLVFHGGAEPPPAPPHGGVPPP
jgi:hypothetical protein